MAHMYVYESHELIQDNLKNMSLSNMEAWLFTAVSFLYVSPYPSQQLHCTESLHPPGYPVRSVVLRTATKETHCNSQYNIALFLYFK